MREHATDVVPRLVTSSWFCARSVSRHVAYKDRSHWNYEKVLPETMYFATPRNKR